MNIQVFSPSMKKEDDPGLKTLRRIVKQYDDGVIRAVSARKRLELAEMRIRLGDTEPTKDQATMMRYLDEDLKVYMTVEYVFSLSEEDFGPVIERIGPAMRVEFEPVPRSVVDAYRRTLSDLELRMEDRAAGYVDDILGLLNGSCEY